MGPQDDGQWAMHPLCEHVRRVLKNMREHDIHQDHNSSDGWRCHHCLLVHYDPRVPLHTLGTPLYTLAHPQFTLGAPY